MNSDGKTLITDAKSLSMKILDSKLYIGESPQLVVDMKNQNNYIHYENEDFPYKKEVRLSPELLQGKRERVLQTALRYYYEDAIEIAEALQIAREYGKRANRTIAVKEIQKQ